MYPRCSRYCNPLCRFVPIILSTPPIMETSLTKTSRVFLWNSSHPETPGQDLFWLGSSRFFTRLRRESPSALELLGLLASERPFGSGQVAPLPFALGPLSCRESIPGGAMMAITSQKHQSLRSSHSFPTKNPLATCRVHKNSHIG